MRRIFNWLKKNNYQIWAHTVSEGDLRIEPVDDFKSIDFSSEVPLNSWKETIFPCEHTLFEFQPPHSPPLSLTRARVKGQGELEGVALFGIRIFDIEALQLYDTVFADDPYYAERRKSVIVIGFAPKDTPKDKEILFDKTFFEERLSHYNFDIFFDEKKYYCGSKLGGEILKKIHLSPTLSLPLEKGEGKGGGVSAFTPLDNFLSNGVNPRSYPRESASTVWKNYLKWKKVIESTLDSEVWNELGKTCTACGKCSIACPTCFCFDIIDEFQPPLSPPLSLTRARVKGQGELEGVRRNRCWGNCFYQEFHRIAPNNFIIDQIRDRLLFWYFHKFVRIPDDYKLRGCVGCERCTKVCPVDINIKKNLEKLRREKKIVM